MVAGLTTRIFVVTRCQCLV